MIPIITPALMQEEEKLWDIKDPIKRIQISGAALFQTLLNSIDDSYHLLFIVGKGLNGADTLALAYQCLEAGFELSIMSPYTPQECKEETCHFLDKLKSLDVIKPLHIPKSGRYLIIDGLFGAGFKGPLPQKIASLIQQINLTPFYKIGIDIPSGIDGTTGEGPIAIQCDLTLSIGFPKWGLFVKQGRNHSGRIEHISIDLKGTYAGKHALGYLLTKEGLLDLYPKENPTAHKYQRGQVIALASHPSYQGASYLLTKAALRSGAGLVGLFHETSPFFIHLTPEVTQHLDQDIDSYLEKSLLACVLGPGLILNAHNSFLIEKILKKQAPTILDGGALDPKFLTLCHSHLILTPHLHEVKKILKETSNDFDVLLTKATKHLLNQGSTLVMKGHHTWVLHKDNKPTIVSWAPSAMATAGSGDVLAGICGAFLAKMDSSYKAAVLAVGLHALSGALATATLSPKAILATDIIDRIPEALNSL